MVTKQKSMVSVNGSPQYVLTLSRLELSALIYWVTREIDGERTAEFVAGANARKVDYPALLERLLDAEIRPLADSVA